MKRFISLMLVLASLILASSCANEEISEDTPTTKQENTDETVETVETETDKLKDNLPETDLNGWKMRIVAHHDQLSDESTIYAPELTGEIINDTIYMRDLALKERFNFDIEVIPGDGWGSCTNMLKNSVTAGTRDYDMAFLLPFASSGTVVTGGFLHNMLNVEHINFTNPWWHTNVNDLYTYKGYLPFVSSDYLISSYQYSNILIFNKVMAENAHTENIYDLVRSGKWTLDKFKEIITQFSQDLDGNGIYDKDDSYGYATNFGYHAITWGYAVGDLSVKFEDDNVVLGFQNERFYDTASWLYEILYNSNLAYEIGWDMDCDISWDTNRVFIQAMWLADLVKFRDCDSEYGIIPYAKFDEAQDGYYTYVDARTGANAIPIDADAATVSNVGLILEAMSCANFNDAIPAYIESVTNAKLTRDRDSIEMMEYIKAGRRWDIGYTFADTSVNSYAWVLQHHLPNSGGMIASSVEKLTNRTIKQFEKVLEAFGELSERTN